MWCVTCVCMCLLHHGPIKFTSHKSKLHTWGWKGLKSKLLHRAKLNENSIQFSNSHNVSLFTSVSIVTVNCKAKRTSAPVTTATTAVGRRVKSINFLLQAQMFLSSSFSNEQIHTCASSFFSSIHSFIHSFKPHLRKRVASEALHLNYGLICNLYAFPF